MDKKNRLERLFNLFLKSFFQGLLLIAPLGLTIFVVLYIVTSVDGLIPSIGERFPGLVFFITIIITAILGYLVNRFVLGQFIFNWIDQLLERTPGVSPPKPE